MVDRRIIAEKVDSVERSLKRVKSHLNVVEHWLAVPNKHGNSFAFLTWVHFVN